MSVDDDDSNVFGGGAARPVPVRQKLVPTNVSTVDRGALGLEEPKSTVLPWQPTPEEPEVATLPLPGQPVVQKPLPWAPAPSAPLPWSTEPSAPAAPAPAPAAPVPGPERSRVLIDLDPALPPQHPPPRVEAEAPPALGDNSPAAPAPTKSPARRVTAWVAGAAAAAVALIALAVGTSSPGALSESEARSLSTLARGRDVGQARSDLEEPVAAFIASLRGERSVILLVVPRDERDALLLPDGSLWITTGLLQSLAHGSDVTALVAHLEAHERLGHNRARLANAQEKLDAARATQLPTAVFAAVQEALAAPFTEEEELAADSAALAALHAASVETRGLYRVFHDAKGAFATTHPNGPTRGTALRAVPSLNRDETERYRDTVLGVLAQTAAAPTAAPTRQ
jgi:hypothetical protein